MSTHIYIYTYTYTLQYIILQHQMAVLLKSKLGFIPNVGLPSVRQAADEDEGDGTLRQSIGHLKEPNRIEGHPNWSACNEEDRLGCDLVGAGSDF